MTRPPAPDLNPFAESKEPDSDVVLSFAEIISALSFAIDLTEGAVPGHAVRSCILGMRIAREMGLPQQHWPSLYYALLLKDAGCSNNAARMFQIVGGDDRRVKNGAKLQDWTKPHKPSLETLRLLWQQVLPNSSRWDRVRRILKIGLDQHKNNEEMIRLRCERGAAIAEMLGLSEQTSEAIRYLDEHWDGSGYPGRLSGEAIPQLSRILAVAQHLDVFASEHDPADALKVLAARSGRWFDPALVRVVLTLEREDALWAGCLPTDDVDTLRRFALELQPDSHHGIHSEEIDRICEAFAGVVDAKSPFTYRHSLGVAEVAHEMAQTLGLAPERCVLIRRAALLHDLGKLAVPNTILDKSGKLTPEEWSVVVQHPRLTREILARIKPFHEIAVIAGAHHERLDGSGYPDKLRGPELCLEARLIAVADFYRALTEDRPYRKGMPHDDAIEILRHEGHALDLLCIEALEMSRQPNKAKFARNAISGMRQTARKDAAPAQPELVQTSNNLLN